MGTDILEDRGHRPDRGSDNYDICVRQRFRQGPFDCVDGAHCLGSGLFVDVFIEPDNAKRVTVRGGPATQAQSDRTADQAKSDDRYALHRNALPAPSVVSSLRPKRAE